MSGKVYKSNGLEYRLFNGNYIDDCLINGKPFEPWTVNWIKSNVKEDSVCIDIGANFGFFSVLMASVCKKIYCFEPMPIYERIVENMELNGFDNYKVFNCVVGNESIDSTVANFEFNWRKEATSDICNVPMVVIDDVVEEKVDFIKVDTDGKELSVIKGMTETFKKHKPIVCQEFAVKTFDFDGKTWSKERIDNMCNWKEILDIYFDLGYEIVGQSFGKGAKTHQDLINMIHNKPSKSSIDVLLINRR